MTRLIGRAIVTEAHTVPLTVLAAKPLSDRDREGEGDRDISGLARSAAAGAQPEDVTHVLLTLDWVEMFCAS